MKIYISYSHKDKVIADRIAERLQSDGHDIWYDSYKLKAGDNILTKINEGLREADAFIIIVSESSLQSKWVLQEFSAIAIGEISKKKTRIIPVLVDKSTVPQYLAQYLYIDLTTDSEYGIEKIAESLSDKKVDFLSSQKKEKRTYDKAIESLSKALKEGRLTLVCGAGVSVDAGIPTWNELLIKLLESMMKRISDDYSLSLENINPTEFQERYEPSALIIGKYLKSNLGNDFLPELRDALYLKNPDTCDTINAIIELSRPQRDGKPLDSIITFNFDSLVEENLERSNIKYKAISTEDIRNYSRELPIYHVHGYLPRKGRLTSKSPEIVFSEDAYHSQFIEPFSWSNLIQLNKFNQNTCLFLGLSLTDPNLRRLLDVSNRKNPNKSLNHFIIKKVPNQSNNNDTLDELALLLEEQDANELGLNVIWISDFDEIPKILRKITIS